MAAQFAEERAEEEVSCTHLPEGGYDCAFVESPPDYLECPVCLLVFRDPHLLSCCGVKICQSCVTGIQGTGKGCPKCRKEGFITLLDKELQRFILGLKVKCSLGCPWEGELRHLEKHISPSTEGDCPLVDVSCEHGCGHVMKRADEKYHEEEECSKRPIELQLARLQHRMESKLEEMRVGYEKEVAWLQQTAMEQKEEIANLKQRLENASSKSESVSMTIGSLAPNTIRLMPKISTGNIPGVLYNPTQACVEIVASNSDELNARALQFRGHYMKTAFAARASVVPLPDTYDRRKIEDLCTELNLKYASAYILIEEFQIGEGRVQSNVKIISLLPSEVDEIARLVQDKVEGMKVDYLQLSDNRRISLKLGDIAKEDVDVIVSTTNKKLSVDTRGVAVALNKASNGELKKLTEKYLIMNGPLEPGNIAVTRGGGGLKCKHVFHFAGPTSSHSFTDSSVTSILCKGIEKILKMAEKVGAKSLAIPAVGAGSYLLRNELIATTMFRAIKDFSFSSDGTLVDIRIVIYNRTVYPAFLKACTHD